ncbi:chain length determinant protein EpsF [Oxalobacteraceae bacterium R-40]|uniref:Chain length determinant protein EpsF n=1 Tax=Keguizhuia sedimenti TaxID=3064264 RepID=A0ABU1BL53_9BURK|nr:chain length determinant protein EpsF [Oxalobacteraceae bacterium R-40]
MTLSQFLLILNARRNIIFLAMLLPLIVAIAAVLILPKKYTATATVVLNPGVDPVTGNALPGQLIPSYLATQAGIIESKSVASRVIDNLNLDEIPKNREAYEKDTKGQGSLQDWLSERILKDMEAATDSNSNVIKISYTDSNPQAAASIANALARSYQQENMDLRLEPAKRASNYFNEHLRKYRAQLETAQNRLSKYQQEKGITNLDNSLDVETVRMNELSTQLVTLQNQLTEARSRALQAKGASPAESPDVITNPTIQNLRISLATAEAKLSETGERFTKNHPRYQEALVQVSTLKKQIQNSVQLAASGIEKNAVITEQREAELRQALAQQKSKVLELNRARDELYVLNKEVESAQKSYDSILQRLSQSTVEGQSGLSEVTILSEAVAPFKSSSPRPRLVVVLALLVGALIGIGLAMLAELLDRRIRTASDISEVLPIPVLGTIEWKSPRRTKFGLPKLTGPRRPLLSN